MEVILAYDSSFNGFLTAVFKVFEERLNHAKIQKSTQLQASLFGPVEDIITNETQANRLWAGLEKKLTTYGRNQIYYSFLSEVAGIETTILNYILDVFKYKTSIEKDYTNPSVLKLSKISKSVSREKHRMEAFVRFKLTKDDIYFANIEPDFDVLPIIAKHFKKRYADQQWLIYDIKRDYGLYYNLKSLEVMSLDFPSDLDFTKTSSDYFTTNEQNLQSLWKDYFTSTNIKSRKNMTLHKQHVPKRYWKYLIEKQ